MRKFVVPLAAAAICLPLSAQAGTDPSKEEMFALSCAAALGLAFSERPETRRQLGGMAVNLHRYLLDRGYDIRELADDPPLMTKILLYMGNTVGSDRDKADAFAGRCYRRFG